MSKVALMLARTLIDGALSAARENGFKPMGGLSWTPQRRSPHPRATTAPARSPRPHRHA